MGLFCIQEENTVEGFILAAINNIELRLELGKDKNDYLIKDFALGQLKEAIKLLKEIEG